MDDDVANYPRLWQDIEKGFTGRTSEPGSPPAWQSRYWQRTVRDEEELHAMIDYVHTNPLKHAWLMRWRNGRTPLFTAM